MWAADPVAAQEKTPTPSAQQLWDAYPLEASPTPAVTAAESPAAQEREVTAPAASSDTGSSLLLPLLAGLVLVLGALALFWTMRTGRAQRPKTTRPDLPRLAPTATPAPKPANGTTSPGSKQVVRQRPAAAQQPTARPRRTETLLLSAAERPAAALPPDPRREWRAELEWIGPGNESRFAVLARTGAHADPTIVAESAPLEWPPTSAAAVQALTDAVAELERELLAAGWAALEPGARWYAKRFGWQPAIVVEPAPPTVEQAGVRAAAPAPVAQQAAVRAVAPSAPAAPPRQPARTGRFARFARRPDWPEGSERLWRCELRWDAGVVSSRFEAVAYEPGSAQRARPVGRSATFKWLMMADPNPSADEYRKELRQLVTALQGAGWDYVGRGAKWYAARFVWRRTGAPPELDAAAAEEPLKRG